MQPLTRGHYTIGPALSEAELDESQALRHRAFWSARGRAQEAGRDADIYDALSQHMLVRDTCDGALVASYRIRLFAAGDLSGSYAAQFYDLSPLGRFPSPKLELGRFCLHPDHHDPDILRLAWAGLARLVDAAGVGLLFGCSSFDGAEPERHRRALAALVHRVGPECWRPAPRAARRLDLGALAADPALTGTGAREPALPPLLRSYLQMGGWVSDHAVIDVEMDTVHVLTAVEVAQIPPARALALRLIAAQ